MKSDDKYIVSEFIGEQRYASLESLLPSCPRVSDPFALVAFDNPLSLSVSSIFIAASLIDRLNSAEPVKDNSANANCDAGYAFMSMRR